MEDMKNRLFSTLIVAVLVQALPAATQLIAGDFRCLHCPKCNERCELKITKEKEKHTGWEVEAKKICIPPVRFPWQPMPKASGCADPSCCDAGCGKSCGKSCGHSCGHVRTVCVLKKKSYECPKCKYTWSPASDKCASGCADVTCSDLGKDVFEGGVAAKQQPAPDTPYYGTSRQSVPTPQPAAADRTGYFPPVRFVPARR